MNLSDEALARMIEVDDDQYHPKAIRIAKQELEKRKVNSSLILDSVGREYSEGHMSNSNISNMKALAGRARITKVIFYLLIAVDCFSIILGLYQYSIIQRLMTGMYVDDATINLSDSLYSWAGYMYFLLFTIAGIAFLTWFYRAYKNLELANAPDMKYSSGWAVGGFFVPILNLVRPFQIMKEIWKGSILVSKRLNPEEHQYPVSNLMVNWWWFLYLTSYFITFFSSIAMRSAESANQMLTATAFYIFSVFVDIPAAVLTLLLISKITHLQTQAIETYSIRYRNEAHAESVDGYDQHTNSFDSVPLEMNSMVSVEGSEEDTAPAIIEKFVKEAILATSVASYKSLIENNLLSENDSETIRKIHDSFFYFYLHIFGTLCAERLSGEKEAGTLFEVIQDKAAAEYRAIYEDTPDTTLSDDHFRLSFHREFHKLIDQYLNHKGVGTMIEQFASHVAEILNYPKDIIVFSKIMAILSRSIRLISENSFWANLEHND